MAIESQGTKLFWSTAASSSTGLSTAQGIGEVVSFNGPGGAANVIDISNLQSTAREKLIGIRDEGQLSMALNFNATDVGQVAMRTDRASRTRRVAAIQFVDPSTSVCYFNAYVLNFQISGAVDDKVSADVTLEIDGPVNWTTK